MTQGPPCPNCGSLLTWYPDQHQWGCDRCRVMYPPQVMVQPQAYARSPERPRVKRATRGAATSKRALIYGGLAAVLVAGGIAVTAFTIHGKKAEGLGWPDRDTAVAKIFGMFTSGDADTLVKRSIANLKLLTCDGSGATPADELREELVRGAGQLTGSTIAIDKITEPDVPVAKAKGSYPTRACKLEQDLETHEVHVTFKTTRNGKTSDGEAKLTLAKVDGAYYVAGAPRMGGCDGAAAWAVMVLGREADAPGAQKLGPPLVASCTDDMWPAKTIDCVANALGVKDEHSCLKDLDPQAKRKLAAALDQTLDKGSPLRAVMPMEEAPKPVTYGAPEKANVADFWLVPRSDGAVLVTSPMLTAVFPQKPEIQIKRSTKPNAAGKLFDIYAFSAQPPGGEPLYELHVIAMGHNMRDPNGFKTVEDELAKLGKVEKTERTEEGQQVTRLAVAGSYVLDGRIDLPHGLIVTASASGAPTPGVQTFLANVHLLSPPDPGENPDTLAGVRQRPGAKNKLVVHDQGDHYTFEIPFTADIKRKVEDKAATVVVGKKGKPPVVTITELAPWDALAITPASLAASQAKLKAKAHLVWEPFQHRMFKVACSSDAPCDPIVKSFHFSEPEPPAIK